MSGSSKVFVHLRTHNFLENLYHNSSLLLDKKRFWEQKQVPISRNINKAFTYYLYKNNCVRNSKISSFGAYAYDIGLNS